MLQVHRADRHHDIAVDFFTCFIGGHDTIGVTVMSDAQIESPGSHEFGHLLHVSGTTPHVDVHAVPIAVDRDHVGAKPSECLGCGNRGSPVPAVHGDLQPGQVSLDGPDGVRDVALHPVGERDRLADAASRGTLPIARGDGELLYLVLDLVRQLEAVPTEELDPVVLGRIVRRGDDNAAVALQLARQERHSGRGYDAGKESVRASRTDARNQRGLQHLATAARVPPNHNAPSALIAEEVPRSLPESEGELRREFAVRDAAHSVGAEEPCAHMLSPSLAPEPSGGGQNANRGPPHSASPGWC